MSTFLILFSILRAIFNKLSLEFTIKISIN
jgi:hypothetical protein